MSTNIENKNAYFASKSNPLAGGIMTQINPTVSGLNGQGNLVYGQQFTVAANVDNALYYHKANITDLQGTRAIYFPFDPSFENFTPTNKSHSITNSQTGGDEFFFIYYITGAPSGAAFNLEITYNIELEPNVGNYTADLATSYSGNEVVQNVTRSLAKNKGLVQQVGSNLDSLAQMESSDFKQKLDGSFLDSAIQFVSDHSGAFSQVASLLFSL